MKNNLKIVCLGGGVGTVNLLRGLKEYSSNITVVVSMADDGGSAGRLRRLYSIPPPGDLINCIAALSSAPNLMKELLTYRFSGNRYSSDSSLPGHKLGNLIMVALTSITGDFNKALSELQRIFKTKGKIIPSTIENLSIWGETSNGEKVYGEENIDLGKFRGKISKLHLLPPRPTAPKAVTQEITQADVVIGGPGDLYTTILPVLLVPEIQRAVKKSRACKIFIVNVANKSFETPDYKFQDYINAIVKHCKTPLFDYFLTNSNFNLKVPKKHQNQYELVKGNNFKKVKNVKVVKADVVDRSFPLYHDSKKLAKQILKIL